MLVLCVLGWLFLYPPFPFLIHQSEEAATEETQGGEIPFTGIQPCVCKMPAPDQNIVEKLCGHLHCRTGMSWSPRPWAHASGLQRVVCSIPEGSLMLLRALWETRAPVTGWNLVELRRRRTWVCKRNGEESLLGWWSEGYASSPASCWHGAYPRCCWSSQVAQGRKTQRDLDLDHISYFWCRS